MKNKLAWIHCINGIAAAITKQISHVFNLKRQEMTNLKRKVSCAKMMEKPMYLRKRIYYGKSKNAT